MLADTAKESNSKVYGVWISSEPSANRRQRPGKGRKAAIRIVTEDVPLDLGKIAGLPEPSSGEIQELKASVDAVVSSLELHGIGSVPIYKDVSLFQSAARNATVDANASREFDTLTTPRPRYTRGLIDGYRQGFAEARQKRDAMALLKDCEKEQEEDELASLAGYFESRFNQR
ncbi:hypothetical protein GGI12_000424 [Dipsacomyces acuminosporus]|nr:hypothetical protein GGI12_000424 [Dipsacomyces acuminosporus]